MYTLQSQPLKNHSGIKNPTNRKFFVLITIVTLMLASCSPARSQILGEEAQLEAESFGGTELVEVPAGKADGAPAEPADQMPDAETDGNIALLTFQSGTDRMVIKDAQIDLLVKDTDRSISQVTQLAAEQGGYIIDARSWFENQYKYAELKLGVPVVTFEHTLNVLRDLGIEVTNETVSGQDVSAEYNDLKSTLTNLEATTERVRGFLEQAKTIEEALTINQTLSELEAQIEQVKGQMRYFEGRSAFSTVTVRLAPQIIAPEPTPTPTPAPPPAWDPGKTFQQASTVTIKNMQRFIDHSIWFMVVYWPLIVFALLGLLLWRYYRRRTKSQRGTDKPSWVKDVPEATAEGHPE